MASRVLRASLRAPLPSTAPSSSAAFTRPCHKLVVQYSEHQGSHKGMRAFLQSGMLARIAHHNPTTEVVVERSEHQGRHPLLRGVYRASSSHSLLQPCPSTDSYHAHSQRPHQGDLRPQPAPLVDRPKGPAPPRLERRKDRPHPPARRPEHHRQRQGHVERLPRRAPGVSAASSAVETVERRTRRCRCRSLFVSLAALCSPFLSRSLHARRLDESALREEAPERRRYTMHDSSYPSLTLVPLSAHATAHTHAAYPVTTASASASEAYSVESETLQSPVRRLACGRAGGRCEREREIWRCERARSSRE